MGDKTLLDRIKPVGFDYDKDAVHSEISREIPEFSQYLANDEFAGRLGDFWWRIYAHTCPGEGLQSLEYRMTIIGQDIQRPFLEGLSKRISLVYPDAEVFATSQDNGCVLDYFPSLPYNREERAISVQDILQYLGNELKGLNQQNIEIKSYIQILETGHLNEQISALIGLSNQADQRSAEYLRKLSRFDIYSQNNNTQERKKLELATIIGARPQEIQKEIDELNNELNWHTYVPVAMRLHSQLRSLEEKYPIPFIDVYEVGKEGETDVTIEFPNVPGELGEKLRTRRIGEIKNLHGRYCLDTKQIKPTYIQSLLFNMTLKCYALIGATIDKDKSAIIGTDGKIIDRVGF